VSLGARDEGVQNSNTGHGFTFMGFKVIDPISLPMSINYANEIDQDFICLLMGFKNIAKIERR